jgi:hypothetical protein
MPFKRCLNFNNSVSDFLDRVGADFSKFSEPVELKNQMNQYWKLYKYDLFWFVVP